MQITNLFLSSALVMAFLAVSNAQFNEGSCVDLQPVPGTGSLASENDRYVLASISPQYTPSGPAIQVFLVGQQGASTFSSVIIQARRDDNDAPVGSFNLPGNFQYIDCGAGFSEATIISNTAGGLPLMLNWSPPGYGLGQIYFTATVVGPDNQIYEGVRSIGNLMGPAASVLTVTCPAVSVSGNIATFDTPTCDRDSTSVGGATCDRVSGTAFPIGSTTVTCTCNNAGETSVCSFTVDVGVAPGPLEISPCPPVINNIGVNTFFWTPPTCSRDGTALGTSTCNRQPGVFMGAVNPVTCTCTAGNEVATCPFNINAGVAPGPACNPNRCPGGIECREASTALTGYTCHSSVGQPCV